MYNGRILQYLQHLMLRLSTSGAQIEALPEKDLLLKEKEWWDSTFLFLSVSHKWRLVQQSCTLPLVFPSLLGTGTLICICNLLLSFSGFILAPEVPGE